MQENNKKVEEFLSCFESIRQSAKSLEKGINEADKLLEFFSMRIEQELGKLKNIKNHK